LRIRTIAIVAGAAVAIAAMTGCAVQTPPYPTSINNVSTLKNHGDSTVAVGAFSVKAGIPGEAVIGMRGNSMTSSVGANYAAYLAEALRSELELARRLDPQAKIEISGVLIRNDLDASGISTGKGSMEAQFVVRRDGQVKYDQIKQASAEWESSFAGAIAIPKAVQNYPVIVQGLLAALYGDAEFQAAIR
jgi:hypothetical protein